MSWRAPLLILLAVALVGIGYVYLPYVGWSDSEGDAKARAEAYLDALVGGSEDRGWSLLVPSDRAAFGSEDAYRRLMAEQDWFAFAWELRHNSACDDGVCSFLVHLPNGRDSAPEPVWSGGPGDPGFLRSTIGTTAQGEAFLEVLQRGWFGGIGVVVHGQTR